jgi:hypothetical protein
VPSIVAAVAVTVPIAFMLPEAVMCFTIIVPLEVIPPDAVIGVVNKLFLP